MTKSKRAPQPVLCLPFVKDRPGSKSLCFWSVRSTGDWNADYDRGQAYAVTYLEWLNVHYACWPSLPTIHDDMKRAHKSGLWILRGFLSVIDDAIKFGSQRAIADLVKECDRDRARALSALLRGVSI